PARVPRLGSHGAGVSRAERGEERVRGPGVEGEARWELHEQAAERGSERRHLAEERIQWRARVRKAALVSDRARDLDREAEPGWHARRPAGIGGSPVRAVE